LLAKGRMAHPDGVGPVAPLARRSPPASLSYTRAMDVKVTGIDEAIAQAREIQERLRQQRPAMDEVAKQIKVFIEGRFEERIAPDGSPWLPPTLNTVKYRESDG